MEDGLYFKVIGYLWEKKAIHEFVDISHLFDNYKTSPKEIGDAMFPGMRIKTIKNDLDKIVSDGYIKYIDLSKIPETGFMEYVTPINIKAGITDKGMGFYSSHIVNIRAMNNYSISKFVAIATLILLAITTLSTVYTCNQNIILERRLKQASPQGQNSKQAIKKSKASSPKVDVKMK